jgi:curved DNA-binding protein CbpA
LAEKVPDVDLYAVLQVSPGAETTVIIAAHRALVRRHHPDVNDRTTALEETKLLNLARDWLIDPARRSEYDAARAARERQRDPSSPQSRAQQPRAATRPPQRTGRARRATHAGARVDEDVAMWRGWWEAAERSGHSVRGHPDPRYAGFPLPEPLDPALRSFATTAERLAEADVRRLVEGFAARRWLQPEFRRLAAKLPGLPDTIREEVVWAWRLPDAFIKARIAPLRPWDRGLFARALRYVAVAIAARHRDPKDAEIIFGVWRRSLGPVPGIDG